MCKANKILIICLFFSLAAASLNAQEAPKTPEEKAKALYENIQNLVDRYTEDLKLEDWQVFYVDSILTHNQTAMMAELESMQARKVENPDIYRHCSEVWTGKTETAINRILNEEQRALYQKKYKAAKNKKKKRK